MSEGKVIVVTGASSGIGWMVRCAIQPAEDAVIDEFTRVRPSSRGRRPARG